VSSQYFRFSLRGGGDTQRAGGDTHGGAGEPHSPADEPHSAAGEPRRDALLERLLARADAFRPVSDWRADAFRVIAPQEAGAPPAGTPSAGTPPVAPAALFAEVGAVEGMWVCLATPVHYVAEMTSVRLPRDGILSMQQSAAQLFATDFNRVWKGSGFHLIAGGSAQLYCISDQKIDAATRDPEDVLEQHIEEYLPTGADAPRLRRLMSEMEMWLFEHEANGARSVSSLPRINGLWLWGGGAPLSMLPRIAGWAAGDDVLFSALSAPGRENSGNGVIVTPQAPGGEAWKDVEKRWLQPASEGLRSGRLSRLEISAGDRSYTLTGRTSRRFWRRSKPWWEYFA